MEDFIFTEFDVRKVIEGLCLNYYRRWRKRRRIFLVVFDFGLTIPWTIPLASCSIFGRKAGWAAPSLGKKILEHSCKRRGHQGQAPENQGIDSPKSKGNAHFLTWPRHRLGHDDGMFTGHPATHPTSSPASQPPSRLASQPGNQTAT